MISIGIAKIVNSAGEAEKILEAQNGETDKKEGEHK